MESKLVEVDSRKRVSLARLGADRAVYLAHREEDGTIVLVPAVVQTELEARLATNPELKNRLRTQMADADRKLVSEPAGRRR